MRLAILALAAIAASPAHAIEVRSPEGELFAFPALLDDAGAPIATSAMRQWFQGGLLHVRIEHALRDGSLAVERATFTQGRELVQRSWSWEERRGAARVRSFAVDLEAGRATGHKREDGKEKEWDEEVKVEPGRTFVGVGVTYAVKNLRDELVAGKDVKLRTVAFLPHPASMTVVARWRGTERIRVGGRMVDADRVEVRPDLKGLEHLLEKVKDPLGADVWLHHGVPPMILRIRYPFAEANDRAVVLETLGTPPAAGPAARRASPPRARR
jgi:hypothetical protein